MKHFFLPMFFAGILLFFQQQAGYCQTFTGSGGAIPDDGTTIEFSINVQGLVPSTIDTSSFGLETVCIDLTHTWDSDLDIRLIAPDGTSVVLTSGNGGSGHNYSVTCFNSHATEPVISGSAPFNGTYRPQGWLGIVNNGQNPNGIWTLRILDTYPWADTGTLHDWSITFGNDPSGVFTLDSSDIPIVVINTGGVPIPDEPKIHGMMGIIWHGPGNINYITDPFNAWYGHIGIEMRGSSSQLFPKKPYAIETRDEFGNNMNVQLLGMPIENDWVLIPNYSDKSLMRNSFTYDLARSMGYWAPRSRFCEVVVNGEYAGVYALMEKIKRDDDRVDILPMTSADISGDALTGGYIIKIDKWTGSNNDGWESSFLPMAHPDNQRINFLYHYPAPDSIVPAQKSYIQSFIFQFESSLWGPQFNDPVNGYYQYIDMNSFIDFFIINELSKNVDGYRLSTFLFKDRDSRGGKLTMGPVWDFDLAYRNADYCSGDDYEGWAYLFGDVCGGDYWQVPFWWDRLLQDTVFTNTLSCRYQNLRLTVLDTTSIFSYIDSVAMLLDQSQSRNFYQWPILGIYVWPNPWPLAQTYEEEILGLKKWFRNRLHWLDNNMPGYCPNVGLNSPTIQTVSLYPNPAGEFVFVNGLRGKHYRLILFDIQGSSVLDVFPGDKPVSLGHLAPGIYMYQIISDNDTFTGKLLIQ